MILSVAAAEAALRLWARFGGMAGQALGAADPMAIKVEPHGVFGYRPRPGAEFHYHTGAIAHTNAEGYRGPLVAAHKPRGVFRIVVLGESSTFGFGSDDDHTIDAYLRSTLASRFPDQRIDVLNLAMDGYDSYQIRQRLLTDGLPREPDLVIVNSGVNDVRNARYANLSGDPDPRTLIWEAEMQRLRAERARGGPDLKTRLKHYFYLARLPGSLRRRVQVGTTVEKILAAPAHPEAAGYFERNVALIADTLARLHVPLLLSTPPSSLRMPSVRERQGVRDYWIVDAPTTQTYRDTLQARLEKIQRQYTANGAAVVYVPHHLEPVMFLDDCHLTPDGNRRMAEDFAAAVAPFLTRGRSGP